MRGEARAWRRTEKARDAALGVPATNSEGARVRKPTERSLVERKYSEAERGDRAVRSGASIRAEETRLAEATERLDGFALRFCF